MRFLRRKKPGNNLIKRKRIVTAKKILALSLAAVMLSGIVACGNKAVDREQSDSTSAHVTETADSALVDFIDNFVVDTTEETYTEPG